MTEKELHKLNRVQLLELFLEQCKRNEALEAELAEAKEQLKSREIAVADVGSIAEASLKLTQVFEEAQKAADLYLANVKRVAGVEEEEPAKEEAVEDEPASEEPAAGAAEPSTLADGKPELSEPVAKVMEE